MENKKIYARQVPPEYQESPLQQCDEYPENVFVFGNRDFFGHRAEEIEEIREALENIAADFDENERHPASDFDVWDMVENYIPAKADGTPWVVGNIMLIMKYALELTESALDRYEEYEIIANTLELIHGEEFRVCLLRGCCQRDWQWCIYPAAYGDTFREVFEAEYFNTGSEWTIHEGDDEPEEPDDIDGYTMYCTGDPRAEIAEAHGVNPADVDLYEFDGYTRRASWKAV